MRPHLDEVDRDAFAAMREERDRHREPIRTYPRRSLARRWAFQARVIDTINEIAARASRDAISCEAGRPKPSDVGGCA